MAGKDSLVGLIDKQVKWIISPIYDYNKLIFLELHLPQSRRTLQRCDSLFPDLPLTGYF